MGARRLCSIRELPTGLLHAAVVNDPLMPSRLPMHGQSLSWNREERRCTIDAEGSRKEHQRNALDLRPKWDDEQGYLVQCLLLGLETRLYRCHLHASFPAHDSRTCGRLATGKIDAQ